jgi:AcrR family transcriptional regulator
MTATEFQRARTPEQQEHRRRDILDAARSLLDTEALAEISLRELSRHVGLSKSNVVRYFPSREAVFLAVLIDDWGRWLDALETRLPAPATSGSAPTAHTAHKAVAAAVAGSLAERGRLCDLIAATQLILEHNVPIETARAFKTAALAHTDRLAGMVASRLPALSGAQAFELAGVTWALVVGTWPMAHPNPTMAAVLAEPQFAPLCVEFAPTLAHILTVLLDGLARSDASAR